MNFELDELVITEYINRWNLPCAGTIININSDNTYDVEVFNMHGPGANHVVRGIPEDKLKKDIEKHA